MTYGFDTGERTHASAAALVYAVYRSRDPAKIKVTPEFWGRVERAVKGAAKRAETTAQFVERLKPKLGCDTLRRDVVPDLDAFLTGTINTPDDRAVLRLLVRETAFTVLLVRDRIERDKSKTDEETLP